ncbi:cation:proton antiporter [Aestuariimicrobium kwangyangense]|uniref:cation:proton antiporter n=1 Tax=Aestuariimicrobium kwangyangense TaxID=396389 RepID=UPI0003B3BF2C|nr:cation:proton antiporter [Aestuariimicrobium kwangyangense]
MSFATLALICVVALLGPALALTRRLRLPVVISELAVGVVLGVTGFGLLRPHDSTFSFLANVGFAMVMFITGTHVPLRSPGLLSGLGRGAMRAVLVGLLAVPTGWGLATAFGTGHAALYAVLLASSSAALVLPALGSTEVTSRPGLEMLAQLVVADTACIIALPLVIEPSRAGRAAVGTVTVVVAAAGAFMVLKKLTDHGRRRRVHDLSEQRGLAIELRVTLVVLFTLAALATATHVSVMLAGFASGLVVAAIGEPRRVAHQMFALTEGFFAPMFFVWLGASLDLRALAQHPTAIALGACLGVGAVVVHGVGTLTRQPWPLAVTTASQLGVPVAAAALIAQREASSSASPLAAGEPAALLLGALVTMAGVSLVMPRVVRLVSQEPPAPSS